MAALKDSYRQALEQTIKELHEDRIKFDTLEVTQEDLINLFVMPEHRDIVRNAMDLYPWGMHNYQTVRLAAPDNMWMAIGQGKHPAIPFPVYDHKNYDKPLVTVQEDAPSSLTEKLQSFMQSQLTVFRQYQLTYQVLRKLDEICASPSQMRFFWPAVEVLAAHAGARDNKETLVKSVMANSKAPVPRISPALRQACQDTSAVITAQQMMGKSSTPELGMRPVWAKLLSDVIHSSALNTEFYRAL